MRMNNQINAHTSYLTCERCHGIGYVRSVAGRHPCLNCAGTASSWIPASQPPASEDLHPGHSIDAWGVVVTPDGRNAEQVAYWPARGVWTATRMDGGEPADVEVEVSHWMYPPELPAAPDCGACPGDGSICPATCRLAADSPGCQESSEVVSNHQEMSGEQA